MEEKKKLLIKLIIELGKFFMECDGDIDEKEIKFINDYTDQMVAKGEATLAEMKAIEDSIEQTKELLGYATEEEKGTLREALSSYIQKIIMADGILHPNEVKFYKAWKDRTN